VAAVVLDRLLADDQDLRDLLARPALGNELDDRRNGATIPRSSTRLTTTETTKPVTMMIAWLLVTGKLISIGENSSSSATIASTDTFARKTRVSREGRAARRIGGSPTAGSGRVPMGIEPRQAHDTGVLIDREESTMPNGVYPVPKVRTSPARARTWSLARFRLRLWFRRAELD
jgi:hypothetical protein